MLVLLRRWALVGVLVLLCAPWLLPSSKLYHQLLIALLWLPALISLFSARWRPRLPMPEALGFLLLAAWTLFVLLIQGGDEPVSQAKVVLYVMLSLCGVLLADRAPDLKFEALLAGAVCLAGAGAGGSWIWFYVLEEHSLDSRIVAVGIWDTVIMAAHAVGAFAVMGFFLFRRRGRWVWFALPALCLLMFLAFGQTRGVWLGLLATVAVLMLDLSRSVRLIVLVALLVGVGLLVFFGMDILLQRGLAYRPLLWQNGLALMLENSLLGIGFHDLELVVPGTELVFRHPHNLFLDTGVRLGMVGLVLFCGVWGCVLWRAWQARAQTLGRALLALWVFSTVSLMTDGIGLWLKPNADWLITWLPVALGMVLAQRHALAQDVAAQSSRE